MKNIINFAATLAIGLGINLVSGQAQAAEVCTDVNVVEISAGHDGAPVEYDVALYTKRVDNGTSFWSFVRHSSFNHTGVQRIERLATSALLSGKRLYLCWDNATSGVTKAYLK